MGRYVPAGQERVFLVTTLSSTSAPTAVQINAGLDITDQIRELNGFTSQQESVDTADMGSTWPKTIPGGATAADSSLVLYAGDDPDDDESTVRDAMVEGANRFLVFAPTGAPVAADDLVDVFPVRIGSANDNKSASRTDAMTYTVGFYVTDEPDKRVEAA